MKRLKHILSALLAVLALMPSRASAQEQMVVVTAQGDLQVYPMDNFGGLSYDATNDTYSLYTGESTLTFGGKDIKQIYFADKAETDKDPYIEPKETDKYNPNFEHPEVGTYDILKMDTALCRTLVQFKGDVPQLYVGKILSLEDEERAYNCYVLAYKVNGKTADICFRFSQINELIYNSEIVLAQDPSDCYFQPAGTRGGELSVYGPRRKEVELKKIKFDGGNLTAYADMGIQVDTRDKSEMVLDAKVKLSAPIKKGQSVRFYEAKIDYMGLVARGTYEKTITVTMTPKVGLKLDYDKHLNPLLKVPTITFPVTVGPAVIPVTLDLSATVGFNGQASIEAELELQQETTAGFTVTAGVEYDGTGTSPIFDVQPVFNPYKPKLVSKQGTIMARFSPYLRIDAVVEKILGAHIDLMPYLQTKYTGVERKGVDDFGSFELEIGANVRGGLYLALPFTSDDDFVDGMTNDPVKKVIYKSPADIKRTDKKVTYCSQDTEDTREYQTEATFMDESVIPDWGQEHAVMQSRWTDFPDQQVRPHLMPSTRAESGLPQPVELHQIGDEWATQCDESAIAHTTFKSNVPLGYRLILKTRILDGEGNTIKELEEEMPWEVKNFDATLTIGGIGGSTIKYRNGGDYIYEHVVGTDGTGDFRKQGNVVQVLGDDGKWYTVPSGLMPISDGCMYVKKPEAIQIYDFCRWQVEEAGRNMDGMYFGNTEMLGLKCKTVTVSTGTFVYWQNLCLRITGSDGGDFHVTSLQILDNPVEP